MGPNVNHLSLSTEMMDDLLLFHAFLNNFYYVHLYNVQWKMAVFLVYYYLIRSPSSLSVLAPAICIPHSDSRGEVLPIYQLALHLNFEGTC